MVLFPNAKVNLGLNIIGKRGDGYHDLESVFYPILIRDAIEIIENEEFGFSSSGLVIEGDKQNNLCLKAYHLLKKDFPHLPAVEMHLHKAIPMGAGLGGGSADGAFTLKLLNDKFDLSLSEKQLLDYALQLGSDCPFFIINNPCLAKGRGEMLEQISLDLTSFKFIIVYPGIHISTAWAFSHWSGSRQRRGPDNYKTIKEIVQQPISIWKDQLKNDFEEPIFSQHPEIKKIKDELYKAGAVYSSMSGSGSAVYGIFKKEDHIGVSFPKNYFTDEVNA